MIRVLFALVIALAAGAAWAGHQKVVNGVIVNIGIVPAAKLAALAEEAGHGTKSPSGSQHVLVSLADAKSGQHLEAAKVSIALTDPKGKVQKKDLVLGRTAGIPDYSEIFMFGFSGKYRITVIVERKDGKPLRTEFITNHAI